MTSTTTTDTATSLLLRVYQVAALLAVLAVLYQFVTAGQLITGGATEEPHGAGAIALHVVSGVAALTAVLLRRSRQLTTAAAALAVVVFGFTFVQAAIGSHGSLALHVPGAMLLTTGVVWQLAVALRRRRG